jgi:hypothetical protein
MIDFNRGLMKDLSVLDKIPNIKEDFREVYKFLENSKQLCERDINNLGDKIKILQFTIDNIKTNNREFERSYYFMLGILKKILFLMKYNDSHYLNEKELFKLIEALESKIDLIKDFTLGSF